MFTKFKERYIGDREFYRKLIIIVLPIIIQNAITNFVSLLDNIMVGQVGTEQMSGVAIANQILMIFFLALFGAISGGGIFTAQFYGKGDNEGIKYTIRVKMVFCLIIFAVGMVVYGVWGKSLMSLYLQGEEGISDPVATLEYADKYLKVILTGLLPIVFSQVYSSTMRESGETVVPMISGIAAVVVNLVFNYLLIFGKFGFPELGVVGAAVATVISRYVEALIVVIACHANKKKYSFFVGLYKGFRVPGDLFKKITVKGMPLLVNETLWSFGVATLTQCYSVRSLDAMAALNISSTITNLFNIVFMAMGNAVAILVGQLLGANEFEKAKKTNVKLAFSAVVSCIVMGGLLFLVAPLFPHIYNTDESVRDLATFFIRVSACMMPIYSYTHCTYFAMRSGGKTGITFLFDSGFSWLVSIPVAFCLSRFTSLPIMSLYVCCTLVDTLKMVLGYVLIKKGIWVNNVVND